MAEDATGSTGRVLVVYYSVSGNTGKIVPSMESIVGRRAVAFTGFNGRQLADHRVYSARLDDFLKSLGRPAVTQSARVAAEEVATRATPIRL